MLYFLPLLLLLAAPLVLTIFYQRWPRLALFWLGLIGITLISWFIVLVSRLKLPVVFSSVPWKPVEFFPASPALVIDQISWPYAFGLVTLLLAIFLTDVVRTYILEPDDNKNFQVSWASWAICMIDAGLGLIAILAQNLLSLIIGWAAIDLLEFVYRMVRRNNEPDAQSAVSIFTIRASGIFFVLIAIISMAPQGYSLEYANLNPQASFWLFLAAGIRLGILPFYGSPNRPRLFAHNLETAFLYFPAIASLALLARLANTMTVPVLPSALVILSLIAGLIASLNWIMAKGGLPDHTFWIAGAASLSFASAIFMQPAASQGWGLGLLLYGGLLALYTAYHRILKVTLLITLIGLTALPLTVAWAGILIFHPAAGSLISRPVIFLTAFLTPLLQSILLIGVARILLKSQPKSYGLERWIWLIFAWGLLLLPLTGLLIAWWGGLWSAVTQQSLTLLQLLLPGLVILLLSGLALLIYWRGWRIPTSLQAPFIWLANPGWFLRLTQAIYRFLTRIVRAIDRVLEGSGGILWTLLLITLLVFIMSQISLPIGP